MSSSGGFFKYRCKYFYTYDCPNWVFVNYAPCAQCCAAGRDDSDDDALPARQVLLVQLGGSAPSTYAGAPARSPGIEIAMPVFRAGVLCYTRTHMAVHAEPGASFVTWQVPESGGSNLTLSSQPQLPHQYDNDDDIRQHYPLRHEDHDDHRPHLPPAPLALPQQPLPMQPPPPLYGIDQYDALLSPYPDSYDSYSVLRH